MSDIFLKETMKVFLQYRDLANAALNQLTQDKEFFQDFGPRSPSIAAIVKHVGGNLKSRWTNFLTTDGEKPDRMRDNEFKILPEDTKESLIERWDRGWTCLVESLEVLRAGDLEKTVTIRGEPHTVPLAIQRSLAHTTYHVGQILYLSRLAKEGDWKWLTIPPEGSKAFNSAMDSKFSGKK